MAENNHQRELALRAPRGVLYDRNGKVLVENRPSYTVSIVRLHTDRPRSHDPRAGRRRRHRRAARSRDRGSRHGAAVLSPDRRDPGRDAGAGGGDRRRDGSTSSCRTSSSSACRRGAIPTDAMAAHLFGYVSEATDAQLAADSLKPGAIVGQAGVERTHNRELMGTDGARTVVVNSMGREIRKLDEVEPIEGRPPEADDRLRRAEGRRRRLQGARLLGRGRGDRPAHRRGAVAGEPAGLRPERVCRRASTARPGRRSTPTSCGRCRTA